MAERLSLREYQRELAARLRDAERRQSASKLGLQIGDEDWLVNLVDAGEILQVPAITTVPLTRPWFRGVTNIRGNLMSVVDFAAFVGGAAAAVSEHSRLLLVAEQFRTGAALLIGRSLGLRNPASLKLQPPRGAKAPWTKAEYTDAEGRTWKELDVQQLVRHPEFLSVAS